LGLSIQQPIEGFTVLLPHGSTAPSGPGPTLYRGFTITLRHTTLGRTILDEGSVPRIVLLPDNTQHSQQTDIHAPGGTRTSSHRERAVANRRLRSSGHWHRLYHNILLLLLLLLPLALQPSVGFGLSNNTSPFFLIYHPSSLNLSSLILCSTFVTISFLLCGAASPKPNPEPGRRGYPFLSGSSPLTCLAWEALPVAYATASIALRIM